MFRMKSWRKQGEKSCEKNDWRIESFWKDWDVDKSYKVQNVK